MQKKVLLSMMSVICALSLAEVKALADGSYEAWYDASTSEPKSPVMPAKVHIFWDGKTFYSKTVNAMGDKFGFSVPIQIDPTATAYPKTFGGTALGTKTINGKVCEGYQFTDPIERKVTQNWLDDTGHLYYQLVNDNSGSNGKYEQTRTDFKLNPTSCALPTDADIMANSRAPLATPPGTVAPNDDSSPFTQHGAVKSTVSTPIKEFTPGQGF